MTLLKTLLFLAISALVIALLTGCATIAGQAGAHPARITCQGKGSISGQGSAPVAGGSFTIMADCGDGFIYEQSGAPQ